MLIGFALTRHCNLRCPHCIRDDVSSVQWLDSAFVHSVVDQGLELFGHVETSLTGGEPLIHPDLSGMIRGFAERGVTYRFVSNGWHMRRVMPLLDEHPPESVRLSLSGATVGTHDAERGRDSFVRVLKAVALLTSRQIPTSLSIVVDRRNRHELQTAADLSEDLGALAMHYILPQPVPATIARDSDLTPEEMVEVCDEIEAVRHARARRTQIVTSYGAPSSAEMACDTFTGERI